MPDDLVTVLRRFHEEVVRPDIERIVEASEVRLRDEMHTLFDALAQRLDRLATDALQEQVRIIEARLEE